MEKTYQLANEGQYGTAKKIAPMTTETVKNQLNCFQTFGSADEPVQVQGVLPDISNFKVGLLFVDYFNINSKIKQANRQKVIFNFWFLLADWY
jgi:hypothetical protein